MIAGGASRGSLESLQDNPLLPANNKERTSLDSRKPGNTVTHTHPGFPAHKPLQWRKGGRGPPKIPASGLACRGGPWTGRKFSTGVKGKKIVFFLDLSFPGFLSLEVKGGKRGGSNLK